MRWEECHSRSSFSLPLPFAGRGRGGVARKNLSDEDKSSRPPPCRALRVDPPPRGEGKDEEPLRRALQLLGALAVIAAAPLQPFQPAIGIARFVGLVLIEASLAPGAAGLFI